MLTALGGENPLFRPFVFMMVTALGSCAGVGHKVGTQFVGGEARQIEHYQFLLAPRAEYRGDRSIPYFRQRGARAERFSRVPRVKRRERRARFVTKTIPTPCVVIGRLSRRLGRHRAAITKYRR